MRAPRSRTATATAGLLAAGALALAACGGGSDGSTAGGAPDASAMAAFRSCMQENGASVPSPGQAPPGAAGTDGSDGSSGSSSAQPPQMDAKTQEGARGLLGSDAGATGRRADGCTALGSPAFRGADGRRAGRDQRRFLSRVRGT